MDTQRLPFLREVLATVDGARCAVETTIERNAVGVRKPAMIGSAHVSCLAANGRFAAFETTTLTH